MLQFRIQWKFVGLFTGYVVTGHEGDMNMGQ